MNGFARLQVDINAEHKYYTEGRALVLDINFLQFWKYPNSHLSNKSVK